MVNKERLVEDFISMVRIDSLSFQERDLADWLKKELTDLGFELMEDDAGRHYNSNCGNIYGFLQGEPGSEPLLLSAHMDTVAPGKGKKAILHEDGTITSDGSTVLGADDFSGIVAILEAVRTIKEQGLRHRSIEVLFTIAEEVYIRGSEVFDYSIIKSREAYVLDLSGPVGYAAIAAPSVLSFDACIRGRAAHAGFSPELGINAIKLAAEAIAQIRQGRTDENTTVNIGMIEGGKARNIVSDECLIKGEVRSLSHEKAEAEIRNIKNTFASVAEKYEAKLSFTTDIGCLAYRIDAGHPVVENFLAACKELGYESRLIDTFGGSDNNNFVKHGISGIVMACGMNKVHSCSEYTHVDELVRCCNIVIKLLTI